MQMPAQLSRKLTLWSSFLKLLSCLTFSWKKLQIMPVLDNILILYTPPCTRSRWFLRDCYRIISRIQYVLSCTTSHNNNRMKTIKNKDKIRITKIKKKDRKIILVIIIMLKKKKINNNNNSNSNINSCTRNMTRNLFLWKISRKCCLFLWCVERPKITWEELWLQGQFSHFWISNKCLCKLENCSFRR